MAHELEEGADRGAETRGAERSQPGCDDGGVWFGAGPKPLKPAQERPAQRMLARTVDVYHGMCSVDFDNTDVYHMYRVVRTPLLPRDQKTSALAQLLPMGQYRDKSVETFGKAGLVGNRTHNLCVSI